DLVAGKTRVTLTNHKKSVRAVVLHPRHYTFASGSPDNIKQWKFPDGSFIQNLSGHNAIINTLTVNSDGVLVSGDRRNSSSQLETRNYQEKEILMNVEFFLSLFFSF
ncbi:PLRG1 isoform 4, partial [Pan troglodytes]